MGEFLANIGSSSGFSGKIENFMGFNRELSLRIGIYGHYRYPENFKNDLKLYGLKGLTIACHSKHRSISDLRHRFYEIVAQ